MRFMTYQSLTGAEIAFNASAVSSPTEIGILDSRIVCNDILNRKHIEVLPLIT